MRTHFTNRLGLARSAAYLGSRHARRLTRALQLAPHWTAVILLALFVTQIANTQIANAQATDRRAASESAARAEATDEATRALLDALRAEANAELEDSDVEAVEDLAEEDSRAKDSPPDTRESETRDDVDRAIERAERAADEAERAARKARAIASAASADLQAYRLRFARKGLYLGAAVFHGLENFDAGDLDTDDGFGAAAVLGYRVHPHVAIEARGEVFDGFGLGAGTTSSGLVEGQLDGFLVTAGPKIYPFTGRLQPFVGLGFGAMRAEVEARFDDGRRIRDRATEIVIRPAAGIDFYLAEGLVLNLEAAYVSSGGDLDAISFGVLSSGLTFRF